VTETRPSDSSGRSAPRQAAGTAWWLPLVASLGLGGFAAALIALHVLRHDLDPIRFPISDYALGRYGWLMTAGFVLSGIGSAVVLALLRRRLPAAARSTAGQLLLALWTAGAFVVAIFPTDPGGTVTTGRGVVHVIASVVSFLALPLAALAYARGFGRDAAWRGLVRPSQVLAVVMLLLFFGGQPLLGVMGLPERLLVGTAFAWLALVTWRAATLGHRP